MRHILFAMIGVLFFAPLTHLSGQESSGSNKFSRWLPYQVIPNLTLLSTPTYSAFGFEWETAPLLYSFGISRLVSPWYFFIVEPPARFTGSVELTVAGQLYTKQVESSLVSFSSYIVGYIPLIERGEHLALNLGLGTQRFGDQYPFFTIAGISTLFGFVQFNIKHSSNPTIWIGSIDFRVF